MAGVLVLTTLLLAPFRACFYRHASLLSGPLQPGSALSLVVLVICLLALAVYPPANASSAEQRLLGGGPVAGAAEFAAPDRGDRGGAGLDRDLAAAAAGPGAFSAVGRRAAPACCGLGRPPGQDADGVVLGEADRPASRFAAAAACCWGWAIRSATKPTGSRRSGGCATWRSRKGWTPRSGAPDRPAEGLRRSWADRAAVGRGRIAAAGIGRRYAVAEQYLVCVAERDLNLLLPVLPMLAGRRPDRRAGGCLIDAIGAPWLTTCAAGRLGRCGLCRAASLSCGQAQALQALRLLAEQIAGRLAGGSETTRAALRASGDQRGGAAGRACAARWIWPEQIRTALSRDQGELRLALAEGQRRAAEQTAAQFETVRSCSM